MTAAPRACAHCGAMMEQPRNRKYCSDICSREVRYAAARKGLKDRAPAQQYKKSCCDECGSKERLNIHHKDQDRYNNTAGNIATLCESCHRKWHKENGVVNLRKGNQCSLCDAPYYACGYCMLHYYRAVHNGDPHTVLQSGQKVSIYLTCEQLTTDYKDSRLTQKQIAAKYNVGWKVIWRYMRKYGIETRRGRESRI